MKKNELQLTTEMSPWHSIKQTFYHNNTECKVGQKVRKENIHQGNGDKPLCEQCKKLSENL